MKKRPYRQKQRALDQRQTRERIVDAAVALHEEVGPAATTISALAERAGVQRLTVYRHFPQEEEILLACSARWFADHPPPAFDPALASELPDDAAAATVAILSELYAYYEETQGMWRSLYRDRETMTTLEAPMRQFDDYLAQVGGIILRALGGSRSKRLKATVMHALRFSTWQSLSAQDLGNRSMADLVGHWIQAAAPGSAA